MRYELQDFGGRIAAARERRGMTRAELAVVLGVAARAVWSWERNNELPRDRTVSILVDQFPELGQHLRRLYGHLCRHCGRSFLANPRAGRLYCAQRCRTAAAQARARRTKQIHWSKRLDTYRLRIQAFCLSCEPEGFCRDAGCPLRAVSPLPLVEGTV